MQTTEIKRDYRQERNTLNRRLKKYYAAYLQTAWEWLEEFTGDLNTITDDRHGWVKIHASLEIECRLREQFSDLWDIQRPYSLASDELVQVWRNFFTKQIKPINEAVEEHVKAWWEYAWRTYRVNFNAVIPAPRPIPTAFKKINQRTYQLGQITVQMVYEKGWREVWFVDPDKRILFRVNCYGMTLEDCRAMALPIAKRLAGLGDWSLYFTLPAEGQVAMLAKLRMVTNYYGSGRWEYKTERRKLSAWKPKEELQAILQAEKDRHAPHLTRVVRGVESLEGRCV